MKKALPIGILFVLFASFVAAHNVMRAEEYGGNWNGVDFIFIKIYQNSTLIEWGPMWCTAGFVEGSCKQKVDATVLGIGLLEGRRDVLMPVNGAVLSEKYIAKGEG